MLRLIAHTVLACVTSGIIFIVISWFSLEYYYIAKYRPTPDVIETFLKNLRFPADRVIGFLPTGRIETAAVELANKSDGPVWLAKFGRIASAVFLIINVGFWIWLLFRQEDIGNVLSISIILGYMIIVSFFSWRLGHDLKSARD